MSEQVLVQEPELKEGNPALSRLLDVLRSGYIQEGLLKSTAERLHQADLRLQSLKQRYLECEVVYSCVCQCVRCHGAEGCVEAAEMQHCLRMCPDQSPLSVERTKMRGRSSGAVERSVLRESAEKQLKSRSLQLVHWQEGGENMTENLRLAKAAQLAQVLSQQVAELRSSEVRLENRKQKMLCLHTQWKALCEVCRDLNSVLEIYKLRLQSNDDTVSLSHLQSQCHAMLGKQELMQYQLLKGVCSQGRLQALQQLRLHLGAARHEIEEKLLQTQQSLQHYRTYGKEFTSLATKYQELLAEIENRHWALNELGKSVS